MKQHRFKIVVLVVLVTTYLVVMLTPSIRHQLSTEAVLAHLDTLKYWAHQPWGPPAFMGVTVLVILCQAPGLIMVVVGALVYSPLAAFAYSTAASIAASSLNFLLFRYLLRDWVQPRLQRSPLAAHVDRFERHGILWMVVIRFVFALSPWLDWVFGASKITARDHLVGNIIGMSIVILTIQTLTVAVKAAGLGQWDWTQTAVAAGLLVIFGATVLVLKKTMLAPKVDAVPAESER